MTTTEMQIYVAKLQNLVHRMALMLDEYNLVDVDIEAKEIVEQARKISEQMVPASDTGVSPRRTHLRIVS